MWPVTFWDLEPVRASLRDAPDHTAAGDPLALAQWVTWCAVAIRKFADAGILGPGFEREHWPVRLHWRRSDERLDYGNWADYESVYELGDSRADSLSTRRLCGLLIHSMVLVVALDGAGEPEGIRFTSALTRDDGLFFIEWSDFRAMVKSAHDATCAEPSAL